MNPWKLVYHRFDPEAEGLREALCTLGNGYLGTRGAVPEATADRVHYPGTYIAGVYNALITEIAGRSIVNEDFVNCPNWLWFTYRIDDGPWFSRARVRILSWKVELHLRKGILSRRLRWQDPAGRITRVENHRLVSMADPHLCALRCVITPENYDGRITIRSGIDGLIVNAGVERYKQLNSRHLQPAAHGSFGEDGIYLQVQTVQSGIRITEAARLIIHDGDLRLHPEIRVLLHGRERIMQECSIQVRRGRKYTIDKTVAVYTSRDQGVADDCVMARESAATVSGFDALYHPHQARWRALWKAFDVEVDGDAFVQQALRLHIFHLLQSASTYNEDLDAGLPARGLHGEAYRGHIFWDELFAFPFYTLHAPEITRALLMYRYRRLGAAKEYARQNGYRGAMYPWQSASTGEETTQEIHLNPLSGTWGPDYSRLQRHVSLAVAFNVWHYYWVSGDRDFLERYGMEMLLEIALFWSSIARFNRRRRRYEIRGVMGPDEFHEKEPGAKCGGLRNNAYTNILAVWVLERTLDLLETLPEEEREALLLKTEVSPQDLRRWRDITRKMFVPIDPDGLIHQFEGYMDLRELDWDEYRAKYDDIRRMDRILKAEGQSPDSYKVAKQADVLMTFFVLKESEVRRILRQLGYSCGGDLLVRNYDYYVRRTSHGSTLSAVVHAYVAEQVGRKAEAMAFLREVLESDIHDTQGGTTREGIHIGVMGGSIDIFLRCFAGLDLRGDRIAFAPRIPDSWRRVRFRLRYRNVWFDVALSDAQMRIQARPVREIVLQRVTRIPVEVEGRMEELVPDRIRTFPLPPRSP